jgi:hypothetical protein
MPTLFHRCTSCGGRAGQSFGESVAGGQLRWYESWWCEGCGSATEGDGAGQLPEDLRAHVLALDGSYRVFVRPRKKVAVLSILRQDFAMSLHDAGVVYRLLSEPFRIGMTRAEAQQVANLFPPEVAEVRVESEEEPVARESAGAHADRAK